MDHWDNGKALPSISLDILVYGPGPGQKVGAGFSVDLVISSVPATPHLLKILA
jgi:hypothetical protein